MSGRLLVRNHQRVRSIDTRLLQRVTLHLLRFHWHLDRFELCLHLVDEGEITELNARFLQQAGPTDVISFDYSHDGVLAGEIFICVAEAVRQAPRFRTTWQSELTRYGIHGLLHLRGFDDRQTRARCKMKRAEDRYLRLLGRQFQLAKLDRTAAR